MAYASVNVGKVCGSSNNDFTSSYNSTTERIDVGCCLSTVTVAAAPDTSYVHYFAVIADDLVNTTNAGTILTSFQQYGVANKSLTTTGVYYNQNMSKSISKDHYLSSINGRTTFGLWYLLKSPTNPVYEYGKVRALTILNTVPSVPATPTIINTQLCVANNLTNRVSLVTPNWANVDYFSVLKNNVEVGRIYSGDNEYYDDITNVIGVYKFEATNVAWNIPSNSISITFAPVIQATIIFDNYPIVEFSAQALNHCDNITNVEWYLDDVLTGTTTGSTFESQLPTPNDFYTLTAKYRINGILSTVSNELELVGITTGSTLITITGGTDTIVIPPNFNRMDYLIVGGGGSGGIAYNSDAAAKSLYGGGGGAGGMLDGTVINPVPGTYVVTVGAGGISRLEYPYGSGGNTSFYGLTAIGGGYGGYSWYYSNLFHQQGGGSGGSGGGGGYGSAGAAGGTGTLGQGYAGHAGIGSGGGKTSAGGVYTGGTGKESSINGSLLTYSTGGGVRNTVGAGSSGAVNTGNGGQGAHITQGYTSFGGGSGGSGIIIVYLYNEFPDIPIAPSDLTSTDITCTGATLTWVNNTTVATGNTIQQLVNSIWTDIAEVSSGDTSYELTNLIPLDYYTYRVVAKNNIFQSSSNSHIFQTLNPAPYNLEYEVRSGYVDFDYSLNDLPFGTGIRPEIRLSGTTVFTGLTEIAHDDTSYTFSGLSMTTNYEARFVRLDNSDEYPSVIVGFTTTSFDPPYNLHVTDYGSTYITVEWNNAEVYDSLWININGTNISIGATDTSYTFNNLQPQTSYTIYVRALKELAYGNSNVITQVTADYLPFFCDGTYYTIKNSVCGSSNGSISIEIDFLSYYKFTLQDIEGNFYELTDFYFGNLPSSFYTLTAYPKLEYEFIYGNQPCIIDWIKVVDTDTTIILDDVKVRNAVCGGFGNSYGRIVYLFTDSNSGVTGWTFTLYNDNHEIVNMQTLTDISVIQYISKPGIYYGIIHNNVGCHYLIDLVLVESETLYIVPEITEVYISQWSPTVEYNYYNSSNEDWYVSTLDTQQYTSTKISEFINPSGWYSIELNTIRANYSENFIKGSNGLVYEEQFTLSIPHADNDKWNQLTSILTEKYIIVFKDANGYWWTIGYNGGTSVKSYRLSENQYTINFINQNNKMITSIDEAYVNNHIK